MKKITALTLGLLALTACQSGGTYGTASEKASSSSYSSSGY